MPHLIGQTVLQYKIVEKLGEGGMGVVYKAEDTRLRRTVALKFLPHDVESHETERVRFLQEAQAAALLNHPNICTIHDILEHEGDQFIVMEYVDGKTLRQIVPIKNMQTAIEYAIQIGEALQEAHSKGIVHRDIKTDNIMVNSKNQIKVMDFGLAKLRGSLKLTKSRSTVGTLAYMAPEQIQGGEVDARSDIFSFGVVLYEMLTGQLPFKGEHEAGIMYAILNLEPEPLESHVPDTPSELCHILNRALEKEPKERCQSIQDMLIDLKSLKKEASSTVRVHQMPQSTLPWKGVSALKEQTRSLPKPYSSNKRKGIIATGTVLLAIALVVTCFLLFEPPHKLLALTRTQLTFVGNVALTDISPDGKTLAYADLNNRVFVQDIAGGAPLEVFRATFLADMRWAPNGGELAIAAMIDTSVGLFIVPRFGGATRKYTWIGNSISWSPDGSWLVGSRGDSHKPLHLLNSVNGQDTSSVASNLGLQTKHGLDWSPAGDLIAVQSFDGSLMQRRIFTTSRDGIRHCIIVDDTSNRTQTLFPSPRWSSRGDAVYYLCGEVPNRDLMKIEIDPDKGKPVSSPRKLHVGMPVDGISISKDNKRLVSSWKQTSSILWSGTYTGDGSARKLTGRPITEGTYLVSNARISPDGKQIAYSRSGQTGSDLFVSPFEGGEPRQMTFGERVADDIDNPSIAWSPDGTRIAYVSSRSGTWRVHVISLEGGAPRLQGRGTVSGTTNISWAPSRFILYETPGDRNFELLDPETGEEKPLVSNDSVGNLMIYPCCSPDGKNIAVSWNRRPEAGLWILSNQDSSQRFLSSTGALPLLWSRDGKSLFLHKMNVNPSELLYSNTILAISIVTGRTSGFLTVQGKNVHVQDLNLTAHAVVWTVVDSRADAWLIENFDPDVE